MKYMPRAKIWKGWKTEQGLNQEQEAFCQLYTSWDREFFGNGVQSYIEVYWPNKQDKNRYKTAMAASSRLLSNVKIYTRINELLEEWWLNDQNIDKQLTALINQWEDKNVKLWALKEYNRLKARVIDKQPVTFTYDLSWKSLKEIEDIKKSLLN